METCAWRSGLQGRGGGGGVGNGAEVFLAGSCVGDESSGGLVLDSHYWKKFRLDFSVPKN